MKRLFVLMLVQAALSASTAAPGPQDSPSGLLHEQHYLIPFPLQADPSGLLLDALVYLPDRSGPSPLAIINHGSPRNEAARSQMRPAYRAAAEWLVSLGYAVVVPTRRGYSASGGYWAEGYGRCTDADYDAAGLESSQDIEAVITYMRRQPFVDPTRIVLIGHSAGGWGVLAAASRNIEGVVGIVNFAGGRGSLGPDEVCSPDHLVDALKRYGASTHIPSLWIYSQNDHFFAPSIARRMYDVFVGAGAPRAEFVLAPASGKDGHLLINQDPGLWEPIVEMFLHELSAAQ